MSSEAAPENVGRFALCSCQYPPGLLDQNLAKRSRNLLNERYKDLARTFEYLLLIGDSVYVDATANLADAPTLAGRFASAYSDVNAWGRGMPHIYAMLDDHELEDNFEPYQAGDLELPMLRPGLDRFLKRFRPALYESTSTRKLETFRLWRSDLMVAGCKLFLANTRTERGFRDARNFLNAQIMSDLQMQALKDWMLCAKREDIRDRTIKPKFVAAPSVFLPRTCEVAYGVGPEAALRSDSWDGYPAQFYELLAFIADEEIDGLVFLGGDAHLPFFCSARLTNDAGGSVVVRCIHAGALYAPFRIANAIPEEFADEDQFDLPTRNRTARCKIEKFCVPQVRDGFTMIETHPPSNRSSFWSMSVDFCSNRNGEHDVRHFELK